MSDFPENLRQAMHDKRCKSADVAKATSINPSVLSRYLSGRNKPSSDNILAISQYLNVSPEWLLSSSDAPESTKPAHNISTHKDKIIELLEQMVADKGKQIDWLSQSCDALADEVRRLEAQVGMLKAQNDQWMASSEARHPKGKELEDLRKEMEERKGKKRWEKTREKAKNPKPKKPKE